MGCAKDLDQRIDPELLELTQEAVKMIPTMYGAKYTVERDELGNPKNFSSIWTAYLAAAMYANAQGVTALLVHGYGIQATALERQGYEVLKRLEFYVAHEEDARLEYLAWPWREKKLLDDIGADKTSKRYKEAVEAIAATKKSFPEIEEYALKNNSKERSLADMIGIGNDADVAKEYAFRYRLPSQLTHLSIAGAEHFLRSDGTPNRLIINFGSTILDPNFVLEQLAMTVIRVLDILDQTLNTNRWPEIKKLDQRLNAVMKRLHPESSHLLEGA